MTKVYDSPTVTSESGMQYSPETVRMWLKSYRPSCRKSLSGVIIKGDCVVEVPVRPAEDHTIARGRRSDCRRGGNHRYIRVQATEVRERQAELHQELIRFDHSGVGEVLPVMGVCRVHRDAVIREVDGDVAYVNGSMRVYWMVAVVNGTQGTASLKPP